MMSVAHACYFKAKELGYEDGDVYVEWTKVEYSTNHGNFFYFKPKDGYLPVKFLWMNEIEFDEFDEVIDLDKENVFFDGCPPYNLNRKNRYSPGVDDYLNKYFKDTGKRPVFQIPKETYDKFRILFNLRNSPYSTQRNISVDTLYDLCKQLKEKYKDKIECNLTGDVDNLSDDMAKEFINVYRPFLKDLNKLFRILNNSNVVIGASSGLIDTANLFGVPTIQIKIPHKEKGRIAYHTKEYWSKLSHHFGSHRYEWIGEENYITCYEENMPSQEEITSFIDKYYQVWRNK